MIDERRIEEAAQLDDKEYYDRLSDNDRCFFEYGFRQGSDYFNNNNNNKVNKVKTTVYLDFV